MAYTGLYGKLPALGDFVSRRLPEPFVSAWDGWLAAVVAGFRQQAADRWPLAFDALPPYTWSLDAGVCGPFGAFVVSAPGRDRVDRRYPLSVAVIFDGRSDPLAFAAAAAPFVARAVAVLEELSSTTADPRALLDARLDELDALVASIAGMPATDPAALASLWQSSAGWSVPLPAGAGLASHLAAVGAGALRRTVQGLCLSAPAQEGGTLVSSRGMPDPNAFASLWKPRPGYVSRTTPPPLAAPAAPQEDSLSALFGSPTDAAALPPIGSPPLAAASVRATSPPPPPDAVLLPVPGIVYLAASGWTLASGSQDAARQIRDRFMSEGDIVSAIASAGGTNATAPGGAAWVPDEEGGRFAWFGNGAIFRLRGEELERFVAPKADAGDGSLADLLGSPEPDVQVGAAAVLPADVEDGDRLLLCADGGYGKLSWSQLMSAMQERLPARAASRLRDVWQGLDVRVPGAIVLAFDLTDQGLEATHACVAALPTAGDSAIRA
jgi:type VI secretion system protein ImpM